MLINIITIVIGCLIGFILGYNKFNREPESYHGPRASYVKKIIFRKNNKCYKLNTQIMICPIDLSME
ncbi:MAG: hypothetical protein CMF62_02405 [Magnetococcales bacterium]|nr:hypothetical protein [Magnetococcales bacterium]|tara:strand:- start:28346 stop:28546 length:201 start_codon:yes stop_codon:yes gene_type:complete